MPTPRTQHFWSDPALPFAESRRAQHSRACYRAHTHPVLSVGAVDHGRSCLTLDTAGPSLLHSGDVVVIPAHRLHACNPLAGEAWSYQMLYLDPAWVEGVVGEMGALDAVVLNRLPPELAPEQVHERLTQLSASLFSVAPDGDKEAALLLFVGDIFGAPWARIDVRDVPRDARRLQAVKDSIAARCAESLSLNDLAREAGMSRYHFVRTFSRVVGMTPHAWQLDRRIERARALLEQGMSLADAALQLGFADQSHFQRAFKQRVAATPGEYRQVAGSSS